MPSDVDASDDDALDDDDDLLSPVGVAGGGVTRGRRGKATAVKSKSKTKSKPKSKASRRARGDDAFDDDDEDDSDVAVANPAKKPKRPTKGTVDSDDDDLPAFVKALKERGLDSATKAKPTRPSRTPTKASASKAKKGSVEWLVLEKAEQDEALARDAATNERRRADDATLEARRRADEAAAMREAKMEEEAALKRLDEQDQVFSAFGEGFVMNASEETLGRSAFASARTLDAGATSDAKLLMSCPSNSLRAIVQKGLKQVSVAREEDVWRVLLLERWLPLSWSKGKGTCDEAAMEWLWDVATKTTCADVCLAARDALLVALGFECKWGAVCDGREARFDYRVSARDQVGPECSTPPWELTASEACDVLRGLGVKDHVAGRSSFSASASVKTKKGDDDAARLRPELFVALEIITAFCDNAFARGVTAFDNTDGSARLMQMLASISVDGRGVALGSLIDKAAAALMASVPPDAWGVFKSKVVKYLVEISNEVAANSDGYSTMGMYVNIVHWLPCLTDREKDLRDSLAAASVISLRHLLPFANNKPKPKKVAPLELNKTIQKIVQNDKKSIMRRRREVMEHLGTVSIQLDTDAKEIWCIMVTMDLVDVVLNGGLVLEEEEDMVEGGLLLFTRFLARKVGKSSRESLNELRTKMFSVKTRYERVGESGRQSLAAAKEAVYSID